MGCTCVALGADPSCPQHGDMPTNALGQPSPGRTDFRSWSRDNLESFARMAADENLVLRHRCQLLQQAWRDLAPAGAAMPGGV